LSDRDPEQELEQLKNALDVVHWYCFQINVKLTRAQMSRTKAINDQEKIKMDLTDSDGSARVALIGIENSIEAWSMLLHHLPNQEAILLEILSILQRLLRMTENEFPVARTFFRPGLDGA